VNNGRLHRPDRAAAWVSGHITAVARGLALSVLTPAGAVVMLALGRALAFGTPGHGSSAPGTFLFQSVVLVALLVSLVLVVLMLVPGVPSALRTLANLNRRLAERWCRVPIAVPYLPPAAGAEVGKNDYAGRLWRLLSDPATWRDLLWLGIGSVAGWVVAALPGALVLYGVIGFLAQVTGTHGPGLSVPLEAVAVTLGLWTAPWSLRAYGVLARSMLAPSGQAELAQRVRHLAQTRTETIDAGAAEIRRIERDLHDGAQARLVAMGMTLDAAGDLIHDNPEAASALLIEARDNSAKALKELRDLIRGIHPTVLADRGLAEAIRALALDSPLRVQLASDLNGRPPAPVESAAYFAVSELLANVSKHAQATQTWIDIRHADGTLRLGVTDNGQGGADPAAGTGLRGIARRLAAFDGVLAITSPPGGPTAVAMEIPCELSSPKTTSC
jgi:signal transduction histidine kinase